jgi:hypothetical protein
MLRAPRLLLAAYLAAFIAPANAGGQFVARCMGGIDRCADLVAYLVPDEFVRTFPPDRFELVVMSYANLGSDGGGLAYATAFVAPRDSREPSQVVLKGPTTRSSGIAAVGPTSLAASGGLTGLERSVVRNAVEDLMRRCLKNCKALADSN